MAHTVVTTQPASKIQEYTAVVGDENAVENMTIHEAEEAKNQRRRETDCCCYLREEDPLYDYWCLRTIADLFVACGICTENTFDKCCCCCYNEDGTNNRNSVQDYNECCQCCGSTCCHGHGDCCDGECSCCECDCGGCDDCDCGGCGDCNCGGCDCDCGGCNF